MLASLASQIPILAPASLLRILLGSGFFDLTPFDQKNGHSSLRVYQDPQKLILDQYPDIEEFMPRQRFVIFVYPPPPPIVIEFTAT